MYQMTSLALSTYSDIVETPLDINSLIKEYQISQEGQNFQTQNLHPLESYEIHQGNEQYQISLPTQSYQAVSQSQGYQTYQVGQPYQVSQNQQIYNNNINIE